jgi:hypothetical protein
MLLDLLWGIKFCWKDIYMNVTQIENLQKIINEFSEETFIYDLLNACGLPKSSITRLKKESLNLSKKAGGIK